MDTRRQGDTLVVRLSGELDLHSAARFRDQVDSCFDAEEGVRNLVLLLRDVRFIDSSGLGALMGRYKRVQARGGRVTAVGVQPRVRRLLEMSGLLKLIDLADNERKVLRKS